MKKTLRIILIIIAVIAVTYALLPQYAQKALIYLTVNIDDLDLFESRAVEAGLGQPWEKHEKYGTVSIPSAWLDSAESYRTVSFLIIKDEQLFFEQYWEDYSPTSYSNSFSAAKTIVGLSILAAIDDGYIESLDQSVCDFIPEFDEGNQKLSIRDVMTMSSGLSWVESYGGLFNSTTEAYYGKDILSQIYELTLEEEPGRLWKYKSGDPQVLAIIVRNATGMSFSDYVSKKFWVPMGAENRALWSLDKKGGMEKAYCCFYTNARDLARFGQLLINKGNWKGKQLISEHLVEELMSPATHLSDENGKAIDFYGYQTWMINYKGHDVKYMRGILGQYVFAVPDLNMVIVRQGHDRSPVYKNKNMDIVIRKQKGKPIYEEHHPIDIFNYLDMAFEMVGE